MNLLVSWGQLKKFIEYSSASRNLTDDKSCGVILFAAGFIFSEVVELLNLLNKDCVFFSSDSYGLSEDFNLWLGLFRVGHARTKRPILISVNNKNYYFRLFFRNDRKVLTY